MVPARLGVVVTLAVLAAGCGGAHRTAPVSGRVTLNDQPLEGAAVLFSPVADGQAEPGPGSGGITDKDGRYTLTLTVPGKEIPGALVGKHKVRITLVQKDDPSDDRPRFFRQLPARYNSKDTTLEIDVPADGTETADFPLKTP
jgi:hypothetical protein